MARLIAAAVALAGWPAAAPADPPAVAERSFTAPNGLTVRVRAQAPQHVDADLQVLCLFRHDPAGDVLLEAVDDLDRAAGRLLTHLRGRGAFAGDELETLVVTPPAGSMRAKALMLVGLGDKSGLTLDTMRRVGAAAVREAARRKAVRVAFAPAIRDQGCDKLDAGAVAEAVVGGAVAAHDTEVRLGRQGLAPACPVREWVEEAGPKYFDATAAGVAKGVESAAAVVRGRPAVPYADTGR